jgi:hypothetical protein
MGIAMTRIASNARIVVNLFMIVSLPLGFCAE